ncbi:MAG: 50S ribosomal protein L35ae [Candidatus Aenigmatarchaeota archaeon]
MKGVILSFRRGRHTQKTNEYLIEVDGCDSAGKAAKYIGKNVIWTSPAGKQICGKIVALHGRKGVLRTRFSRGLPGTALGQEVEIKI